MFKKITDNITPFLLISSIMLMFLIGLIWQRIGNLKSEDAVTTQNQGTDLSTGKLSAEVTAKIPKVSEFDHIRGDNRAEVKIIEYLDFECRFCREFYETAQRATVGYNGEVVTVFRHYPLDNIHPNARKKSEAAECVAQLKGKDAFFEFTDKFFKQIPYDTGFDEEKIVSLAEEASVNKNDFLKCLNESQTANIVEGHYQGGLLAGIRGTPQGFIVNDKGEAWLIPEALPEEQMRALIDEARK